MKRLLFIVILAALARYVHAEEGMWIPILLEKLNIRQMQDMGLRLTAEEIYSINHSSLKDAIVQFGGGCTGTLVSSEGLILTNHHCGYGAIQRHSSLEHDYLTDGFWAENREDELPNPGLTVTFLIRMEDVTGRVLSGVGDSMNQMIRGQVIRNNMDRIEKESVKGTHYEAKVRSFFYGNQYYLFITEVFRDIRLVGSPPSAIGQFGGDTDNWMWPRHGGDFSVFRIYADKNNEPAIYSEENVPYHQKSYLPVSLKGYRKGDFTFVFGFPGSTREYLTSYGVDLIANKENPVRTGLRQIRLDIFNRAMQEDRKIRIQYSSKHAGIANGWKKMIGETRGINRMDAVGKKQEFERRFQAWADSVATGDGNAIRDPGSGARNNDFTALLAEFRETYDRYLPVDMAAIYLTEAGMGIEIVRFASGFRDLVKISGTDTVKPEEIRKLTAGLKKSARTFFKDYQPSVDRQVMISLLGEMEKKMDKKYLQEIFGRIGKQYGNDLAGYAKYVFEGSLFADSAKLISFIDSYRSSSRKKLEEDPAYRLMASVYSRYDRDMTPLVNRFNSRLDSLQRIYMGAQMEMQPGKRLYPDANSTLRISYGKVDDYSPSDAVNYRYFTTGDGILEKEDSMVYDYAVSAELKVLLIKKDFGRYADADGTLHIAFTASNHTTGGNSGSPVLDAEGRLIGLNYDRNWEGTLSDLMYDPDQCRNIALDIRYCLFIIEKVAGAGRLIGEMDILE